MRLHLFFKKIVPSYPSPLWLIVMLLVLQHVESVGFWCSRLVNNHVLEEKMRTKKTTKTVNEFVNRETASVQVCNSFS